MLGLSSEIKLILWTSKPVNRKITVPKDFFFLSLLFSLKLAQRFRLRTWAHTVLHKHVLGPAVRSSKMKTPIEQQRKMDWAKTHWEKCESLPNSFHKFSQVLIFFYSSLHNYIRHITTQTSSVCGVVYEQGRWQDSRLKYPCFYSYRSPLRYSLLTLQYFFGKRDTWQT